MRNTLFRTVVTSLAALSIDVSLAATPVFAAEPHGGGGTRHVFSPKAANGRRRLPRCLT